MLNFMNKFMENRLQKYFCSYRKIYLSISRNLCNIAWWVWCHSVMSCPPAKESYDRIIKHDANPPVCFQLLNTSIFTSSFGIMGLCQSSNRGKKKSISKDRSRKRVPNLNDEEWLKIFSYLEEKEDKESALMTCKRWFTLIRNDPKLSGYVMVYFQL